MNDSGKAVFLSYASQDAEAARQICDALRAAGVEVWFDQSELRGGDAWDQSIRRQIKTCALFVPIISGSTQARSEGYFRLEWKLADDRTHLMAKGTRFILPVCVDDTKDWDAVVPDSFTSVQWTRLPAGDGAGPFAERIRKLLAGENPEPSRSRPAPRDVDVAAPIARRQKPIWLWVGLAMIVAVPAYFIFKPRPSPEVKAKISIAEPAEKSESPSEVGSLLARVRSVRNKTDVMRGDLDTTAGLLERAAKLDANNAEVWAEWGLLDWRYAIEYYDRSTARFDAARRHVAQAVSLDPKAPTTRLAQALVMALLNRDAATKAAAVKILESLLVELPDEGRVPLELGWHTMDRNHPEVALAWFDRAAKVSGEAGRAHFGRAVTLNISGSVKQAGAEFDLALAAERAPSFLLWKAYHLTIWEGDTAAAQRVLAEVPPQLWVEDMAASVRYLVNFMSRDYEQALAAMRAVPHDYLDSVVYSGPTGYFKGEALARAGKPTAARLEWQSALGVVEKRLAQQPNDEVLMQFKALLLSCLGDQAGAAEVFKAEMELYGNDNEGEERAAGVGQVLRMRVLPPDQAFAWLAKRVAKSLPIATAARLRLDPVYDPVRSDPRFPALLAQAETDPKLSPTAIENSDGAIAATDTKSVAVLAFTNLSDDKNNEYFSDGISEELLTVLQKIPGLHVAARTSAFSFKGKNATAQEIGQKLGVANLVEGSVQKSGTRVKITARLSRVASGEELWSRSFTREVKDVFSLQEELALAIVDELRGQLTGSAAVAQVKAAVTGGTTNAEAYQNHLQGRYFAARHSEKSTNEAIRFFQRAVELDPSYVLAWVGLARGHVWLCEFSSELDRKKFDEHLALAREAAARAFVLDPRLPEALLARSVIQLNFDFDWAGASETLRTALELAPADPEIVTAAGNLAGALGDTARAAELYRRAVSLDPVNASARIFYAFHLAEIGRYEEARREFPKVIELNAEVPWAYAGIGLTDVFEGKFDDALKDSKNDAAEWARLLITALAQFGQKKMPEADAALAELVAKCADTAAYQIAEVYAYRGDRDRAFQWLERARVQRDGGIVGLIFDPLLANLKGDPRWDAFLVKVGLRGVVVK